MGLYATPISASVEEELHTTTANPDQRTQCDSPTAMVAITSVPTTLAFKAGDWSLDIWMETRSW
jgi:hypothetical protein